MSDRALRDHVAALIGWEDAHAGLEQVVDGVPPDQWGAPAPGLPYTLWQLLEHLRLTQHDILDFCRNPGYTQPRWPEDYWPAEPAPPDDGAAARSIAAFREERQTLAALAGDESLDLFARIPHGTGQTYLRELLLVADHTSYHLGQMVVVRRALGIWE
ncbi:MAG: DinB family protein [Gemmatimonadales bacterium]|nr:DinB family protein [Gemmatimonadales bacterium]